MVFFSVLSSVFQLVICRGLCATDLARYVVSGRDEPLAVSYARYHPAVQQLLQVAVRGDEVMTF